MNQQHRSHEELLDLVAVYALGALDGEEAREASAHIAACDDCRVEFEALRPAADAVALSVDDRLNAINCARMKSRLMEAVAAETAPRRIAASPQIVTPRRLDMVRLVAALALAAVIVMGFFYSRAERNLDALQVAGARTYSVADGEILKTSARIYIVMRTLPQLPPGKVYQAWTLAQGAQEVAPSLTFIPDAHGFVMISLPESSANIQAVAVSVEPAGGSRAPTTKPLFVQPLS